MTIRSATDPEPRLTDEDAALLVQLSKRLATTANVETGEPTNKLILIRDLRAAFIEAGIPRPTLAQTAMVADVLRERHNLYRKA